MRRSLYSVYFVFMLFGCNSGGGGGQVEPPPPPPPPTYNITVDGYVPGFPTLATVTLTDFTDTELATAEYYYTAQGQDPYQLLLVSDSAKGTTDYVAMTSGDFLEMADNIRIDVQAGDTIRGCGVASTITNWITPSYLTTLACGLTSHDVDTMGLNGRATFQAHNTAISDYAGFTDILTTDYGDINDPAFVFNVLTDDVKNTLLLAAISQLTLDWSTQAGNTQHLRPYTTPDFITAAFKDIRADGLLDGVGKGGSPVMLGNIQLSTNTYRHELAKALIKFTDNTNNRSGILKADIVDFAKRLNDSTVPIFNSDPTIALNEGGPYITNFLPADKSTISGDQQFSAHIHDTCGTYLADYYIDDVYYSSSGTGYAPIEYDASYPFYVPQFQAKGTSAVHTVSIAVTDVCGGTATERHFVTFDNP